MKVSLYFTFLISLLSASCSEKERGNNVQRNIELIKQKSVTLELSDPLFGKFYEEFRITEDSEKWIFADKISDRVYVYNHDGSFLNTIGDRGKGPRGIVRVGGFDVNDDSKVFVYDPSQRMIKIFSIDDSLSHSSQFLKGAEFGSTPFEITWYKDRILTTIIENEHIYEPAQSKLLSVVTTDGIVDTLFGTFDPFAKEDNSYVFFNELTIDHHSGLVYTNLRMSPNIQVFDPETKNRVDYISADLKSFVLPDQEITPHLSIPEINKRSVNTTLVANVFLTEKYIVQHIQVLTDEWYKTADYSEKDNILAIYDRQNHHLVDELNTDYTLGAVQDNKLYFIEDFNPDNYTIGIYKLSEFSGPGR